MNTETEMTSDSVPIPPDLGDEAVRRRLGRQHGKPSAGSCASGIVLGEHWHPSGAVILAVTVLAAVLAALHELLTCFLWCSFTSWWIGRRMGELKGKR